MFPENAFPRKPQKEQLAGLQITEGERLNNIEKLIN